MDIFASLLLLDYFSKCNSFSTHYFYRAIDYYPIIYFYFLLVYYFSYLFYLFYIFRTVSLKYFGTGRASMNTSGDFFIYQSINLASRGTSYGSEPMCFILRHNYLLRLGNNFLSLVFLTHQSIYLVPLKTFYGSETINSAYILNLFLLRNKMMESVIGDEEMDELLGGDWCGFEPGDQNTSTPGDDSPAIMDITSESDIVNIVNHDGNVPLAASSPKRPDQVNVAASNFSDNGASRDTSAYYSTKSVITETDSHCIGPIYTQCRNARTATLAAAAVGTSVGIDLGKTTIVREDRVGSLDIPDDQDLKRTFRGTRISSGGTTV
jgi:hypothetical protein